MRGHFGFAVTREDAFQVHAAHPNDALPGFEIGEVSDLQSGDEWLASGDIQIAAQVAGRNTIQLEPDGFSNPCNCSHAPKRSTQLSPAMKNMRQLLLSDSIIESRVARRESALLSTNEIIAKPALKACRRFLITL